MASDMLIRMLKNPGNEAVDQHNDIGRIRSMPEDMSLQIQVNLELLDDRLQKRL